MGLLPDAVSSLKAILAQNSVMPVDVIAKLESIEESLRYFKWILAEEYIFIVFVNTITQPKNHIFAQQERPCRCFVHKKKQI